ncbi:MAG: hypothetical protein P8Z31_01240 [Gammaproteobacteria bacterium]
MRIAISVSVDTLTGATSGVERLLALFRAYDIKSSFFVSLGPGRDCGFLKRRMRSNHIATHADAIAAIPAEGHDLGMAPWDSAAWAAEAAHADEEWTREQWQRALESWQDVFGTTPSSHAASAFQANPWLFRLEQQAGLAFASDLFGKSVFHPVMQKQQGSCPQLPVTLAPAAVLRASGGIAGERLHEELFALSQKILPSGQHWRIGVDEEPELVEKMIVMWKGSWREFQPLSAIAGAARAAAIRQHAVGWDQLADGSWAASQSLPFADLCR